MAISISIYSFKIFNHLFYQISSEVLYLSLQNTSRHKWSSFHWMFSGCMSLYLKMDVYSSSSCIFTSLSLFVSSWQPARERNRNSTKTETWSPRSSVWSSPTCSAERSSPSSRRTSDPAKRCRSPSRSSWVWSSPPSATSSWTPGVAAWTAGRTSTRPVPVSPAPRPPLSPKRERAGRGRRWRMSSWQTSARCTAATADDDVRCPSNLTNPFRARRMWMSFVELVFHLKTLLIY